MNQTHSNYSPRECRPYLLVRKAGGGFYIGTLTGTGMSGRVRVFSRDPDELSHLMERFVGYILRHGNADFKQRNFRFWEDKGC
jgi:hypothetical protein